MRSFDKEIEMLVSAILAVAACLVGLLVGAKVFKVRPGGWAIAVLLALSISGVFASQYLVGDEQITAREYWSGWAVSAISDGPWVRRVHHSDDILGPVTSLGADGKLTTTTGVIGHNDYDTDDPEPASYRLIDSNKIEVSIDREEYLKLKEWWGNSYVDTAHHEDQVGKDQVVESLSWDGTDAHMEAVTTVRDYINRVQASREFKFAEVSPEQRKRFHLVDHPETQGVYCPAVLGDPAPGKSEADAKLQLLNAKLGKSKQVHVFLIVYRNQPEEVEKLQEALWKRGNKNEYTVCVGIDSADRVTWCRVISWTKSTRLMEATRTYVLGQGKLDLPGFATWLYPNIQESFVRLRFRTFNRLTVDPPTWSVAFCAVLAFVGGLAYCGVKKEYLYD